MESISENTPERAEAHDPSEEAQADVPSDDPDSGREKGDAAVPAAPGGARAYSRPIPHDRIDADAIKVVRRLARHGHTAYLVGGCVRDLLLGHTPKDFDVATSAAPSEVRRIFRNCRIIGRRFRLAHILFSGGKVIEVATFRRDPSANETPDRLAQPHASDAAASEDSAAPSAIEPSDPAAHPGGGGARSTEPSNAGEAAQASPSLQPRRDEADLLIRHDNVFGSPHEDARRRDFTINGLFYDVDQAQVIDYVGGLPDLQAHVVQTIGEPDVRFREDPVRMLRAIKFSARLDLGMASELYDALIDQRDELSRCARPRLLEELLRLLRGGAAQRSMFLAWQAGVLAVVLPEVSAFLDDTLGDDAPGSPGVSGAQSTWDRLVAADELTRRDRRPSDAVLMAALLLDPLEESLRSGDDPSVAFQRFFDPISARLTLPRRLKDRLRIIVLAQRRLRNGKVGALARRDFFTDAAMLFELDCMARGIPVPQWAQVDSSSEEAATSPRRRRRRRRRRSSNT